MVVRRVDRPPRLTKKTGLTNGRPLHHTRRTMTTHVVQQCSTVTPHAMYQCSAGRHPARGGRSTSPITSDLEAGGHMSGWVSGRLAIRAGRDVSHVFRRMRSERWRTLHWPRAWEASNHLEMHHSHPLCGCSTCTCARNGHRCRSSISD